MWVFTCLSRVRDIITTASYVRGNVLKLREGDRLFPGTKLVTCVNTVVVTCVLVLLVKVVLWIITHGLFTGSEMQPYSTVVIKGDFVCSLH